MAEWKRRATSKGYIFLNKRDSHNFFNVDITYLPHKDLWVYAFYEKEHIVFRGRIKSVSERIVKETVLGKIRRYAEYEREFYENF